MKRILLILLMLLYSTSVFSITYIERVVEDNFDNVKEDITLAITGQGLMIAHRSDVATMLNRTAQDLEKQAFNTALDMMPIRPIGRIPTQDTYQHGLVIEFCSARLSAETTESDPNNILFCPFSIAVFQLNSEPNQVHVSYLRLSQFADANNQKSVVALTKVENMLAKIVTEALD